MKRFLAGAVLVCGLIFCGAAGATILTSLYGDRDGFGLGYRAGQMFTVNSTFYNALNANRCGDPAGTDTFGHGRESDDGTFAWRQWNMSLEAWRDTDPGEMSPASLTLQLQTGAGHLFYRRSTLYFDADPGEAENWMAVGRFARPRWNGGYLKVRQDVFDLMPLQEWIMPCLRSGSVTFRVETRAGSGGFPYAGWMMDYSALSISDGPPPARIPESPTLVLLCVGLAALLILRNRCARAGGGLR